MSNDIDPTMCKHPFFVSNPRIANCVVRRGTTVSEFGRSSLDEHLRALGYDATDTMCTIKYAVASMASVKYTILSYLNDKQRSELEKLLPENPCWGKPYEELALALQVLSRENNELSTHQSFVKAMLQAISFYAKDVDDATKDHLAKKIAREVESAWKGLGGKGFSRLKPANETCSTSPQASSHSKSLMTPSPPISADLQKVRISNDLVERILQLGQLSCYIAPQNNYGFAFYDLHSLAIYYMDKATDQEAVTNLWTKFRTFGFFNSLNVNDTAGLGLISAIEANHIDFHKSMKHLHTDDDFIEAFNRFFTCVSYLLRHFANRYDGTKKDWSRPVGSAFPHSKKRNDYCKDLSRFCPPWLFDSFDRWYETSSQTKPPKPVASPNKLSSPKNQHPQSHSPSKVHQSPRTPIRPSNSKRPRSESPARD